MSNKILSAFIILSAILAGCTPREPESEAKIQIETSDITNESAKVTVRLENSVSASYMCRLQADALPSADDVLSSGVPLKNIDEEIFTVSGLDQNTGYTIVVAASSKSGINTLKHVNFTTKEGPDDPGYEDSKTLTIEDGFMVYDGQKESTGLYTMNAFMWTAKKNAKGEKIPYYDVVLFTYHKNDLPSDPKGGKKVPYGIYEPFYEKSPETWSDRMYHIGKHVKNQDGTPNFQGVVCAYIDENGETLDFFVANDIDNSKIEIADNGDDSYTIKGSIADNEKKIIFHFSHQDTKPVLGGW